MSIDASTPEVTRAGTTTATDPRAAALMRTLDRLVGTWTVSGPDELSGEVRYEWMDGGSFVVQHVNLCSAVERTRGVEYIGYDEVSGELRSTSSAPAGRSRSTPTGSRRTSSPSVRRNGTPRPASRGGSAPTAGRTSARGSGQEGGYESTMTRSA